MSNLDDIWTLWREKAPGLELHIYYVESFGVWVVSCAAAGTIARREVATTDQIEAAIAEVAEEGRAFLERLKNL